MSEPVWIDIRALLFAHAAALAEHGGPEGLGDPGLLDSALARPKNLYAYEGVENIGRLAASYAFGIVRNHPFIDGNKRVAFITLALFLRLNGLQLQADQVDAVGQIVRVAAGESSEEELALWIDQNAIRPE